MNWNLSAFFLLLVRTSMEAIIQPKPISLGHQIATSPQASSWESSAAALYTTQPDVSRCQAGTLKHSVKMDVLQRLNAVRAIHRLPAVTYSYADDEQTAQSSLIMAANGKLSHVPPTTWKCYSEIGKTGAETGNLLGGTISPYLISRSDDDHIAAWLTEIRSTSIGHRRWMLDPFLGKISYGRVSQVLADGSRTNAATLKVFKFTGGVETPKEVPPFVAYPYGDYPARYMHENARLSFSVVKGNFFQNREVQFGAAQVRVTAGSTELPVSNVQSDNEGAGVPNSIEWKVAGLQSNVRYTVRITGVTGAPQSNYEYTFRLIGNLPRNRQRMTPGYESIVY